jgi:hypothetical protein
LIIAPIDETPASAADRRRRIDAAVNEIELGNIAH